MDVNKGDPMGQTALMWAIYCKLSAVAERLLAHPQISVNQTDNYGNTALILASRDNSEEVVKLLVAHPGMQIGWKNKKLQTAEDKARTRGYYTICRILTAVPRTENRTICQPNFVELPTYGAQHTSSAHAEWPLLPASEHFPVEQRKTKKGEEKAEEMPGKKTNCPSTRKAPALAPECPVCFEDMAPPKRIFHCSNGHHLCENCYPNLEQCTQCRQPYVGRATDMEKFIRTCYGM
eukprot:GFUD01036004.1.p1 GENE.GFUD01036004.1~~GFUD01036004.1.p1  ORF type:complete len:235 (-),score=49.87 GFUD01036004.1:195-899(-)